MANLLSTLHSSAKTAVPTGAGLLISVPSAGGRAFDELAPSALGNLLGVGISARFVVAGGNLDLAQNGATTGQVLAWSGSAWAPATPVTYTIPAASGALLGGSGTAGAASAITIGSGLSLSGGTLSATGGGSYTLPVATGSVLGGVKAGTGVTIAGDGTISTAAISITPVVIDGSTIAGSSGTPYQMLATSRVVEVKKTTGAATVINWPTAPVLGEMYTIIDGKGDAAANPITVNFPAGVTGTITGWTQGGTSPVASVVLNAAYDAISVRFTANATTGRVV